MNRDWVDIVGKNNFGDVVDPDKVIASEYLWGIVPASDNNKITGTAFTDVNGDTVYRVSSLDLTWLDGTTERTYTFTHDGD